VSCGQSATMAHDLAVLLEHLRAVDTRGRRFRGGGRGGELSDHDRWVAECIIRSEGLVDTDAMRTMWASFRTLPREDPDVMCHGDLTPSNLLVEDGHLVAVLDTGGFRAADPALDLVCAWHLLSDAPRAQLRRTLGCTDLQWERGRAWAFQQAAGAYWYYRHSNAAMAEMGRTTLHRLIAGAH
jgi:aminoglycoside phosphotransferase (APT) family kinase protein